MNYEAVSYVWGTNEQNRLLPILDEGTIKYIPITEALEKALPFLSHKCSTGFLWIDQLCIDQDNVKERNHQVSLMDKVYSLCERVLIWLGLEDDNSK